ncbi:MAG: LysM peptidoglycan-binding domain-containing protein [Cellulomonadaceae bacterium]
MRTRPARVAGLLALPVIAGAGLVLTVAGAAIIDRIRTDVPTADLLVALLVTALGAATALWYAFWLGAALLCQVLNVLGERATRLESAVHRHGPALARRALAGSLGAGIALGSFASAYASSSPAPTTVAMAADPEYVTEHTAEPSEGQTGSEEAPFLGWTSGGALRAEDRRPSDPVPAPVPARGSTHVPAPEPTPTPTPEPGPEPASNPAPEPGPLPMPGPVPMPVTQPAPEPAPQPHGPPTQPRDPPSSVTVRPGDSLWAVAARHLPAPASNAQVAAAWPRWYAHNAATIGPDPHLIHPGTVLHAPPDLQETD